MKLAPYCDGWVHTFRYVGKLHPAAVYRCLNKVTEWGVQWKQEADGRVRIVPKLMNDMKVHRDTGLEIQEMQGLDNDTVLLVIEEKVPGSGGTRIYGLILDYSTMELSHCESLLSQALLDTKDDILK